MDFDFSDDQEQLRDAVRKWVDKGYDFDRRRAIVAAGGFDRAAYGEMAELGKYSVDEHDAIGRIAVRLNIDQVVVVGEGAKIIHMGASQEGSWDGESKFFASISDALPYLRGLLGVDDVVLVKSSNSAGLRVLGDALAEVSQ